VGAERTGLNAAEGGRIRVQLTREGTWFVLLLVGVLIAAVNTGNNLLYLVLGSLCGLLLVNNVLAEWNLRGLSARRHLPAEAFAGHPVAGCLVLVNRRRWGTAWAVRLEDLDKDGTIVAEGIVLHGPVDAQATAPVRYVFEDRGQVQLRSIRIWSTHPFGLVRRSRRLPMEGGMVVYPAPVAGVARTTVDAGGQGRDDKRRRGREGDFRGLRVYQAGDPLRDVHWPTSAKAGRPMVVERAAPGVDQVIVEVLEADGERWEQSLRRAAGQVLHHAARGHAVGLAMGAERLSPRAGAGWRRHLMERLAVAPRRPVTG